ncbi:hypothetical protein AB0E01_38880 [Nocardia vinacea]|uniref:hypothetical protein n=1 Tax=Nocardia vinacea TaxID=96468 RepID=UPI0033C8AF44
MIGRLMIIMLIPGWVWALLIALVGLFGIGTVIVVLAGNTSTSAATDLHYQCDSAVGPDPALATVASTTTITTSRRAADSIPESAAPTTNPYAEWTIAPDDTDASDWQRSCASAMRSASWQLPPLQTVNTGLAVECARQFALAVARTPATLEPGRNGSPGAADGATLTKSVIDAAASAAMTGQCLQSVVGTGTVGSSSGVTMPRSESTQVACGRPSSSTTTARSAVVLPSSIAAQGVCGQRVDTTAVSPGDLVFWDYRSNAPTRVGVAVDTTHIVTVDSDFGQVVEQALPTGSDVRVKRVLKGDS